MNDLLDRSFDTLLASLPKIRCARGFKQICFGWRRLPGIKINELFAVTRSATEPAWDLTHLPSGYCFKILQDDGENLIWLAEQLTSPVWASPTPQEEPGYWKEIDTIRPIIEARFPGAWT